MLVNLTPNQEEIERRMQIAKQNNFKYIPQSDPKWLIETGIYRSSVPFNFPEEEFVETLDGYDYDEKLYDINKKENETMRQFNERNLENWIPQYGVADSIEQIKEFYAKQINDKKQKFIISVSPVYQDKENKGKGGGWRWDKWGKYIGNLNPKCEYLDDEEFGDDFQHLVCFNLYAIY